MSDETKNRRETLRTHMILTSVTATLAFAVVIAASLFIPVMTHFDSRYLTEDARAGLADHILYLHSGFWPVVGVALLSSVVSAVMLFNRMTAPLVRIVRMLRAIEGGHVPAPIVIRRSDYLQEEARVTNSVVESLRARWEALREIEVALRDVIAELTEHDSALPPDLHPHLEALRKSGAELRAQIDDVS